MALMTREFFVAEWLKARPFTYLWSHMLIVPLIDLYATACDWLPAGVAPPAGLGWFLAASFFNGIVVEIGRKLRAPADEEPGVETYSAAVGPAARRWPSLGVRWSLAAGCRDSPRRACRTCSGPVAIAGRRARRRWSPRGARVPASARGGQPANASRRCRACGRWRCTCRVGILPLALRWWSAR